MRGRLTRDELGARAGRALAARTRAELAALAADIPAVPAAPAGPVGARPVRPPAPARRGPLARAAAKSGICLVIATAAVRAAFILDPDPGPTPYHSWAKPMLLLAFVAVVTALCILGHGVATSSERRRSRRQLPPRPGPGGQALEAGRRGGTGHGPVPPTPAPTRPLAPTCGFTSHGSTFPPWRAGYPVTPGRRRARYDAGDTGTALTRGLARVPSCHQARTTLARAYGGRCDASHGKGPGQGIIPGLDLDVARLALMPQPPATLSRRW